MIGGRGVGTLALNVALLGVLDRSVSLSLYFRETWRVCDCSRAAVRIRSLPPTSRCALDASDREPLRGDVAAREQDPAAQAGKIAPGRLAARRR